MNNKVKIAIVAGTFIILGLIGYKTREKSDDAVFVSGEEKEIVKIIVHVTGEVNEPGVYEVADGCRVYEVIEKAGGETDDADTSRLNLAKIVADGEKLVVPKKVVLNENGNESTKGGLVNINTSGVDGLSTLSRNWEEHSRKNY